MAEVLLLTHERIGQDMLDTAEQIVNSELKHITCIEVPMDSDVDELFDATSSGLDPDQETLILTDLYGSTPSNIGSRLAHTHNARMVSGLNMAMLLRVANYINRPIDQLTEIAIEGGTTGINSY